MAEGEGEGDPPPAYNPDLGSTDANPPGQYAPQVAQPPSYNPAVGSTDGNQYAPQPVATMPMQVQAIQPQVPQQQVRYVQMQPNQGQPVQYIQQQAGVQPVQVIYVQQPMQPVLVQRPVPTVQKPIRTPEFGSLSVIAWCNTCHKNVSTRVTLRNGCWMWFCCCVIGTCALCMDGLKDSYHYCPHCNSLVGSKDQCDANCCC
eukprot:241897_1